MGEEDVDLDVDGFVEEEEYEDDSVDFVGDEGASVSNGGEGFQAGLSRVLDRLVNFAINFRPEEYPMEVGCVGFIILYIVIFFYGCKANREVAKSWYVEYLLFYCFFSYEGVSFVLTDIMIGFCYPAGHRLIMGYLQISFLFWVITKHTCW